MLISVHSTKALLMSLLEKKKHPHLDFVPRMCPTIRFERPTPIICTEVASPIAVPKVAWGTTRGMDGHILAW